MGKPAVAIALTAGERAELAGLAYRRRTVQRLARPPRGIVLAASGRDREPKRIAEVWARSKYRRQMGVG